MNMTKSLTITAALLAFAVSASAQNLLEWNTFGNAGTETSEPSTFNNASIASASLTLGPSVTAAANGNRFGGNNWAIAFADSFANGDYIQFTVTPLGGATFTPTSFNFYWDRSSAGPTSVALRSSVDSFASNIGTVTGLTSGGTFSLSTIAITGLTNLSSATTFRLYGFGGMNAISGTGGFDSQTTPIDLSGAANVYLAGSVSVIPEPSAAAAIFGALALAGVVTSRRRRAVSVA